MNAREKFTIGQAVRLTEEAWRRGLRGNGPGATGRVVGFSEHRSDAKRVFVKTDSAQVAHLYHMNFWKLDTL